MLSKAGDLVRAATALAGKRVLPELHVLLRSMNSYYTNRIEGQHTRPHEIEQALRKDFSSSKELAAKQRLAVAHIEVGALAAHCCDRAETDNARPRCAESIQKR